VWRDDVQGDAVFQRLVALNYYETVGYFYFITSIGERLALTQGEPDVRQERPYGPGSRFER